jgi:Tfp pilus assembly PilM family ATPase
VPEDKPVALADFGATKTLICVTDGEQNVFREFPVGGIALTEMISQRLGCDIIEAERIKLDPGDQIDVIKDAIYPGIEDITAEIRSCMDTFKSMSMGREADTLLLSGGLVGFSGVSPLIGRLVKVEPRIFDSFGTVDSSELDPEFIGTHGHEFAVAFGLACHARDD